MFWTNVSRQRCLDVDVDPPGSLGGERNMDEQVQVFVFGMFAAWTPAILLLVWILRAPPIEDD